MMFEFGYNNPKYADRKLRIVLQDADFKAERPSKRRRFSSAEKTITGCEEENEELYVNTLILGRHSLYFRRIFDGECYKESFEKVIDVHINKDEKDAFLDLIKYLYTDILEADTVERLLQVWHLAQRFLIESCAALCLQRLTSLPLSLESSCYLLDAASVVNQTTEFKELVNKSVNFLANHFKVSLVMNGENSSRWENFEDLAELSAPVLESLLASDDLQVVYEDSVYFAVKTWIKANCEDKKQEAEAWEKLGPLIRWPTIEMFRVKSILEKVECPMLRDLLVEALIYHASSDEEKKLMETTATSNRFRRRIRHAVPLRFLSVGSPVKCGVVFFSLSLKDWKCLQDSNGPVFTERFSMAGCVFIWLAQIRTLRKRVSILLVALDTPPCHLRIHIAISVWNTRMSDYALCHKGLHSVNKDVRERVALCLDCFGKDVDDLLADTDIVSDNATWFKTELQVIEG
ncbi:hypothetical protein KP509_03G074500 [Ceratopteris richardii]|uniref:BTB domain-containing protein n=1 Tax=Ceratopteris richardii TaxID=49495 RepID=A0A8T2VCM8_CERRI|nr:hypothetical protein KP509_03G074500 [Ceratopteris richardii]